VLSIFTYMVNWHCYSMTVICMTGQTYEPLSEITISIYVLSIINIYYV